MEIAAARQALEQQIEQTKAAYEHQVLNDLSDAEKKVAELGQDLVKAGLLQGKVISVSQDAIVRDKPNAKAGGPKPGGALSDTSEPDGQELLYSARVSLDGTQMQIEDKMVSLAPGMAVTVEIKTGTRRLIEY